MAWVNALDIPGAELVARDPADPNVWFDPIAAYPDYISELAGVVTVLGFSTQVGSTPPPPVVLEFGVRLPVGYEASNTRVSVVNGSLTPPQDGSTVQLKAALVFDGGADVATANMSANLSVIIDTDITSPTEIGAMTAGVLAPIVSARAVITGP